MKNNNIFNYEEKQNIDKINEYRDKKENENISENRHKVLTSIGEEEEKSKNHFNDNSEEELHNTNNNVIISEDMKNSIDYLYSLLQNKYDDNKKSILYNFFKNLRKIRTNSLFYKSVKFKGKINLDISENNTNNDKNN